MTVALPRRASRRAAAGADLSSVGIHRDPATADPVNNGTLSQRIVNRASAIFSGKSSRRSFLTRTAMVGSALAVGPIDFLLKPGTAYGYLCGTCSDGWTAFCCTIMNGRNVCPPNSFVAGWWKADNAAYCCGSARYIIDCNATCPTQCSCRCAGGSCDNRRTCCNQFRYGQCNTQIACYGPVVCRVATCTPPWQYDPSCTTSPATDNRTRDHGAPCLTTDCGSPIARKYAALGGAAGFLGPVVEPEKANADRRGRRAVYRGGNIYWTSSTGAQEVHGDILTEFSKQAGINGPLRYPTADTRTSSDGKSRYSNFENGRIYYLRNSKRTFTVPKPFFAKHEAMRGVHGFLGYPNSNVTALADGVGKFQSYGGGRIYVKGSRVAEVHGAVFTRHQALGGVEGVLGYPINDLGAAGDGRGKVQWFDGGLIFYSPQTGAYALWGKILARYAANGHVKSYLKYPVTSVTELNDGRGGITAKFEQGRIYASSTTDGFQVHGAVLKAYLDVHGGPSGVLGFPISELDPRGAGRRFQRFEGGRLEYVNDSKVIFTPN